MIYVLVLFLSNLTYTMAFDAPKQAQYGFQDPASPIAEGIQFLHDYIMVILIFTFFFVFWFIFSILYKYNEYEFIPYIVELDEFNAKQHVLQDFAQVEANTHGVLIEIIWTIIPAIILVFIAIPSFSLLYSMDEIIDPQITIKAIGHKWYWSYEYSDYALDHGLINFDSYLIKDDELELGQFRLLEVDNRVILPTYVHVRVLVTSGDVLHSWSVPSLGVKVDAVPGRLNETSFFIKREGLFFGQCSELCGVEHGYMPIAVQGLDLNSYLNWVNDTINE